MHHPFCDDDYMFAHPALSPDGNTLYFTSDMPGGFGGMDIWKSEKKRGKFFVSDNNENEIEAINIKTITPKTKFLLPKILPTKKPAISAPIE